VPVQDLSILILKEMLIQGTRDKNGAHTCRLPSGINVGTLQPWDGGVDIWGENAVFGDL